MPVDITIVSVLNNNIRPFQTLHKKSLHALIAFWTFECSQPVQQNRGGATVLKVGGQIFFDPPLFGQWGGQNIA